MNTWAPVVAALGASLLTGLFTWGANWWVERRRDRTAERREKTLAYQQLISRSLTFCGRTEALRKLIDSALNENDAVRASLGRPFGQLDVYDWLEKDYVPINDAWSKIRVIGSPEAVDEATQLLDACAELLDLATSSGDVDQQVLNDAGTRVIETGETFIRVARKEVGEEAVASQRKEANGKDTAGQELTQEIE